MKKYFLVLLLSVTILTATGQNVTIPDNVARYFLEQNLKAQKLDTLVQLRQKRITNLEQQIVQKDVVIGTLEADSKTYDSLNTLYKDRIKLRDKELELSRKEINKHIIREYTLGGAAVGAAAGSVLGQPIIGAVIGTGVGYVVGIFKRKKKYEPRIL